MRSLLVVVATVVGVVLLYFVSRAPRRREGTAVADEDPAPGSIRLTIQRDGSQSAAMGKARRPSMGTFGGDGAAQDQALTNLRGVLREFTAPPGVREAVGPSEARLEIECASDAPWLWSMWALQTASNLGVGIGRVTLRALEGGDGEPWDLLPPGLRWDEPIPEVRVVLFRRDAENPALAWTDLRVNEERIALPVGVSAVDPAPELSVREARDATFARVRSYVAKRLASNAKVTGGIETPLQSGRSDVPFGDVVASMRGLRQGGIERVELLMGLGAPLPVPSGR